MNGAERSHGLWAASAPPAPPTAALHGAVSVDVAVVGAGFTGLSAALHLAEGGASVAVLEARDIGFGAAGRNVGLVNAGLWLMPSDLLARLPAPYGLRLLQALGDGPSLVFELVARHGMACEAVREGTLHCAVGRSGEREVAERARQWLELGAPVEVLDARRTRALTGTAAYPASLLDRRAGTVQPLAYVRGLAAAALRAGARVHTGTPVTAVDRAGSAWQLRAASGATVTARWVVLATDMYAEGRGPWQGLQQEQVLLPYFNFATPPLPPGVGDGILPQRHGAWDTRQVLSSFRRDAAGRLVVGSVGALEGLGARIHRDWAARVMARLFPQLRGVGFEHAWHGAIGMTPDALPRLHMAGPCMVSASGFNGRGIAPGTVLGRELARLVLGEVRQEDLPLPVTPLVPARWRSLRSSGYEAGARAFHWLDARA